MEKYLKTTARFLKDNKKEIIIITIILILAAFLRLYKIREFIIFLGDEGRDALTVKRMIVDHKFTLLGPTASVGGFYLGPIYYYFMIPFLWAFKLDPVGPAVMVAMLGTATVALLYLAMRQWFNKSAAVISSLLFSTSPGIVMASRSSWNPNIMPFFALFSIYSLFLGNQKKKSIWYILAGASFGIAIQSHYLGLILGLILAVATFVTLPAKQWFKAAILEIIGFFTGASMYFVFEIRHNFPNIRSVIEFVTRGGDTTGPRSWNLLWLFSDMNRRVFEAGLLSIEKVVSYLSLACIVIFLVFIARDWKKDKKISLGLKLILVWLVVGTFGIGAYKGQLHPHYFGFLFPLPFIIMGYVLGKLLQFQNTKIITLLITIIFVILNIINIPIWKKGSNLINQTINVSKEIINISDNNPYNFALASQGNSDHAYRYFVEILDHKPTTLDEQVTEQLIVVCEDLDNPCKPLGHPLWEIAGFGRAEIVKEAEVYPGIKIVKLVHHQDSENLIGKPAPKGGY